MHKWNSYKETQNAKSEYSAAVGLPGTDKTLKPQPNEQYTVKLNKTL